MFVSPGQHGSGQGGAPICCYADIAADAVQCGVPPQGRPGPSVSAAVRRTVPFGAAPSPSGLGTVLSCLASSLRLPADRCYQRAAENREPVSQSYYPHTVTNFRTRTPVCQL